MKKKSAYVYGIFWGAVFVLFYAVPHGGFGAKLAVEKCWIWGNACSIGGVLLCLIAGALKLDQWKVWDWLLYALYQARFLLLREKAESYTNFRDFKELRAGIVLRPLPIFITGMGWIAAGYLLSMMYYRV